MAPGLLLLQTWSATPFLDLFLQRDAALPLTERALQVDAGGRQVAAFMVTPRDSAGTPLPAVVMASGREGLTDSLRQFARETAGIGYVTLAVDYRGAAGGGGSALLQDIIGRSNDLAEVVGWLSGQPAVDPKRLGALAWNDAFDDAKKLADAGNLIAVYPVRVGSQAGMTEQLWVDVYEYLGKYVEDALLTQPSAASEPPIVRVIDIMRAINSDEGVRGRLARALTAPPAGEAEWEQARSDAAMLAEGGNLLLAQRPAKGSLGGWRLRATDLRGAAEALLRAVEARDFAAAQQRLRELPRVCAACHADYR